MKYNRYARIAVAFVAAFLPSAVFAGDNLVVPDASQIQYAIGPENAVYLRNLNLFDSTWQGCCTSYTIDLTTDAGKAQFSALLSAALSHTPISLYVGSKVTGGVLLQVGRF